MIYILYILGKCLKMLFFSTFFQFFSGGGVVLVWWFWGKSPQICGIINFESCCTKVFNDTFHVAQEVGTNSGSFSRLEAGSSGAKDDDVE